jgi:hypothetical protein
MLNAEMSDFEKLIIAQKYVEVLKNDISQQKIENGMLQSELDEIRYISKEDLLEIKSQEYVSKLVNKNQSLKGDNEALRDEVSRLNIKCTILQKDVSRLSKLTSRERREVQKLSMLSSKNGKIRKLKEEIKKYKDREQRLLFKLSQLQTI